MSRTPSHPAGSLLPVATRLPAPHLDILDAIATGLSQREGQPITRGAALRILVTPLLEAVAARKDVAKELDQNKRAVVAVARSAVARGRRSTGRSKANLLAKIDVEGLWKALGRRTGVVTRNA